MILKGKIYTEVDLIHSFLFLVFFSSWQQGKQSKFRHNQAADLALPFW